MGRAAKNACTRFNGDAGKHQIKQAEIPLLDWYVETFLRQESFFRGIEPSDIEPRSDENVFDIECNAQENLYGNSHHGEEKKGNDTIPKDSQLLHEI